ncbi:MAG: mitochondrial fission ELM1 family protein [Alphaproteobacteria bacterium]
MINQHIRTWVITEGLAGTENQCLGVAEALGVQPEVKRMALRQPWKTLSPYLAFEQDWSFLPALHGPWPDLLLASGRKSIAASRYIKKMSGGKTFIVQIQDPRISAKNFDLVAVPEHDSARGDNVIVTTAAPNRISPEKLGKAKEKFPQFGQLKSPRIAVLFGGNSKAYTLEKPMVENLIKDLEKLDAGFMVTASRRTGDENIALLKQAFAGKNSYFWDGSGENPYFAYLAWADYILVTADSVSMISEAATTGKPVYVLPLAGGATRLLNFVENLKTKGIVRIFAGKLEDWTYEPLRDAAKIAGKIRQRLAKRD